MKNWRYKMIVDKIENAHLYAGLSGKIAKALEILKDTDFAKKTDSRYDVDGDNLFYIVERYETNPVEQGRLEAHKKYIDVQFIAGGEEMLGYYPLDKLQIEQPYDEQKDIAFYKVPGKISSVNLEAGMFCVLFPQDAHMPCRQLAGPANVLKVVVKVKING